VGTAQGYTGIVPAKDPHVVLGVEVGAGLDEVKAAWRRLARQHHPDLTGDDPAASQRATRRMAEINAAYAALTRPERTARGRAGGAGTNGTANGTAGGGGTGTAEDAGPRRPGGRPPAPRPSRPVTGRLDTTETFRPRNATTTPGGADRVLRGQAPRRHDRSRPALRASQPSGPTTVEQSRHHRPRTMPLDQARGVELEFGKFPGHPLGEGADFAPSYIDWLASTLTRDPDLTAAARAIRDELDRQGIVRPSRPQRPGWRSNPFI
jgi:curved DNA-binding protein CbpA